MKPILLWVGGKKQLYPQILAKIPANYNTYYEPFVGGGFVFLATQPTKAIISDLNDELINVYKIIKTHPNELIALLKTYHNEEEFFYNVRSLDRDVNQYLALSMVELAARTIFLNHTCFRELYRVNAKNQFNVPFADRTNPTICDEENIIALSEYFNKNDITFIHADFNHVLKTVKVNDFVYLDPPCDPISSSASFTGYTTSGFSRSDRVRLKEFCDDLNKRDVKFLLSNSNTDFINELYKGYKIEKVYVNRNLANDVSKRNTVQEVLISNY